MTGEVVWASDEKYIALNEGESPPEILTWDAQMGATFSHIEEVLGQLYVMAELSPAAFGETKSGLAESGSALKRLMLPTLAKVNRLGSGSNRGSHRPGGRRAREGPDAGGDDLRQPHYRMEETSPPTP